MTATKPTNGLEAIGAEYQGHFDREGFTPERDDGYVNFEFVRAGTCYASFASFLDEPRDWARQRSLAPLNWPWSNAGWKPGPDNSIASRKRELEKAGALLAKEWDRLHRIEQRDEAMRAELAQQGAPIEHDRGGAT